MTEQEQQQMSAEFRATVEKIPPHLMRELATHWVTTVALEKLTHQATGKHFCFLDQDGDISSLCLDYMYSNTREFTQIIGDVCDITGADFEYLFSVFYLED